MLKLDLYDGETFEMHSIPIEFNIETEKFEIGRLNLIVFDFDKANLNKLNNELVTEFAKEAIKTNSDVNIIGTTDILGTQDYNQLLSQRRADNTANTIRTVLPDANFIQIRGKGSENPRYDNSLPEGRFYNRTVLIEVRTPIK
jgi:outer membrane protein OmpA-like peptidoglycan-associated protein